ncbi:MAG: hypothetical protein O3C63_00380 [Cyanobacteria bacterium]|nr:hypothetical protein [Cyanobacteriota bacterium]MDA1020875.1 hypothetical protein [Cyanobacteriota bacterium]
MLDESNLKDANQAYLDTDYQLAQTIYQELVQEHPHNPMLLINLANSEYKIENNGKAIKHYYQAKKISPRSKEVNNNLAIVLEEIKLSQDPMLAYSGLSVFESLIFFLVFNILYLMRNKLKFNSSLNFIVVLCLVISSANLAWLGYEQKNIKRVVVTDISTKAYSGDSEAYSELFELLDGQILQLVKPGPDWSQIKYGESLGWVKNSSYELI